MANPMTQEKKELSRIKKLAGKYTELAAIKNDLESYRSNLANFKQQGEELLEQITTSQTESQTQNEAIKQIVNEASAHKESIIQTKTQAEEHRDSILNLENKVSEQSQKVEQADQKYMELSEKLTDLESEVKKQLAVATGGTLADSFARRKKQLTVSSYIWLAILGICLVVLILWIPNIVNQIINGKLPNIASYFLKFSVTFPLIGATFFFAHMYSKERELEEEYAFKSSVALSLAAYQKLLKDELPEGSNEKVIEFITNSVTNIYIPPTQKQFKISKKEKDIFGTLLDFLKEANKLKG